MRRICRGLSSFAALKEGILNHTRYPYTQRGLVRAFESFRELKKLKFDPDAEIYEAMVRACSETKEVDSMLDVAAEYLGEAKESKFSRGFVDSCIVGLERDRRYDTALQFFAVGCVDNVGYDYWINKAEGTIDFSDYPFEVMTTAMRFIWKYEYMGEDLGLPALVIDTGANEKKTNAFVEHIKITYPFLEPSFTEEGLLSLKVDPVLHDMTQ